MALQYVPEPRDRMILRRRVLFAAGHVRARVREVQAELLAELQEIDADVQRLVDRRSVVVDGLRLCRDAISNPDLYYVKRDPLPADIDATPQGTSEVRGPALRLAIGHVLRAAGRPLTIEEIHRGLLARGLHPAGRASQVLSNALAVEARNGRVAKIARGEFEATGCTV